ncbi:MAG: FG-GAP repeat protein, partial [Chloroflexota bacterium]
AGNQVWHQNSPGVADAPEANDSLGQALSIGDWNRDGRADLAIGVPSEDLGAVRDAGVVHILFGSPTGLTAIDSQLWSQDSPGVEDAAEADDHFGAALASGDMNGDTYPDLAIGVPDETVGGLQSAGAVQMLFGSSAGLTAVGSQFWHQDAIGAPDKSQARDQFGRALACGDLNGDGYADLAVGLSGQNLWGGAFAGAVVVLHGSSAGLTVAGNQFWSQESPGIAGNSSGDESFGRVLAAGDLNGDGYADLAVGAPGDKRGDWLYAGSINVFYGSAAGLTAQGAQYWTQGNSGLMDVAEEGDNLSTALAISDFDRDGRGDLAASAPYEDLERYGGFVPLLRR